MGHQCNQACGRAAAGELQRAVQLLERAVAMYPDAAYDRQLREVLARPSARLPELRSVLFFGGIFLGLRLPFPLARAPCEGDAYFAGGCTYTVKMCS